LYNRVVFRNEQLPDGSTAELNYLFLGDVYLDSLNSFYQIGGIPELIFYT